MRRRDFGKASLGAIASTAFLRSATGGETPVGGDFTKAPGLTESVGKFIASTKYKDIPQDVVELGKKSILDGLGLALAGSRAQTGTLCREYVEHLGICDGKATVIGSSKKTSPRFAAFVNGVSIHADDFDDTQLAVAKDRVYGLLVHPTVPVLPALLALAEGRAISGRSSCLHIIWVLKWNARSRSPSRLATIRMGFTPRGPVAPSGRRRPAQKYFDLDFRKY